MTCDSLQERAGRGLSDDTNHVAVRAHGEATEANKDRRHQNLSAPDILIFNTNFPPPKMYKCARLQNVRVGEICVKTTSKSPSNPFCRGLLMFCPCGKGRPHTKTLSDGDGTRLVAVNLVVKMNFYDTHVRPRQRANSQYKNCPVFDSGGARPCVPEWPKRNPQSPWISEFWANKPLKF